MEITKELLEQKRQEYVNARDQVTQQAWIYNGAIQGVDHLLSELAKESQNGEKPTDGDNIPSQS